MYMHIYINKTDVMNNLNLFNSHPYVAVQYAQLQRYDYIYLFQYCWICACKSTLYVKCTPFWSTYIFPFVIVTINRQGRVSSIARVNTDRFQPAQHVTLIASYMVSIYSVVILKAAIIIP